MRCAICGDEKVAYCPGCERPLCYGCHQIERHGLRLVVACVDCHRRHSEESDAKHDEGVAKRVAERLQQARRGGG